MSRLAPRLLALVAAVVLGLAGAASNPQPAFACECSPITPTRAARQADAVFRGTVTALRKVDRGEGPRTDIRFEVDAVYKGSVYAQQVVSTPRQSTECGLTPEPGTTWVIFSTQGVEGRGDEAVARLTTDSCRGNLPTTNTPRALGTPLRHRWPVPPTARSGPPRRPDDHPRPGHRASPARGRRRSGRRTAVLWRPGRIR